MMKRHFGVLFALFAVAAVVGALLMDPDPALGTAFTVNSTADNLSDDGACTLREAVKAARENINVNTDDCGAVAGSSVALDTITLVGGTTYVLSLPGPEGADTLDLDLVSFTSGALMIQSNSATNAIIDGGGIDRVMDMSDSQAVTLDNLTITNGTSTSGCGGAIRAFAGNLTLQTVNVTNSATTGTGGIGSQNGGGICLQGTSALSMDDSAVTGNAAGGTNNQLGGGLALAATTTHTITRSLIASNSSGNQGSQLLVIGNGTTVNLTNSTVSNGSNATPGILISVQSGTTLNLENATIATNVAAGDLLAINPAVATANARSTIFSDPGNACSTAGEVNSQGNNVDDATTCLINPQGTDKEGVSAELDPLASNPPGNTQTHALQADSPAINAGDAGTCPATDQRGVDRPMGGGCDAGAYESPFTAPTPSPTPTLPPTDTPDPTNGSTPPPQDTPTPSVTPTGTGGATPTQTGGVSPTPTPTATPTPSATPEPTGSPAVTGVTATSTPSPTPTPTATPGPTETPGAKLLQGDVQCDGDVDSVDALQQLRDVASLETFQEDGCPAIGLAGAVFGDVDCDGDVDSVDALKVLRHVAALEVAQTEPCTDIGEPL